MKECIVVGRPNSGKTLFTIQFAAFLGTKNIDVTFRAPDGLITCRHYEIDAAKQELCGLMLHKTRMIQSITLKMRIGKTLVHFKLTDTCGLTETMYNEADIRRGMSQTLSVLRYSEFIFHLVDLTQVKTLETIKSGIDKEIHDYGLTRPRYVMLANKIDIPSAKENFTRLKSVYPDTMILPISALYCQGFREVKACVARSI